MNYIEKFIGISPDGGDGSLEILLLVLLILIITAVGMHLPHRSKGDTELSLQSFARRYAPSEKPQIASRPATTRPTHETFIDTGWGPICTVHPLKILQPCKIATNAKMSAVTDA